MADRLGKGQMVQALAEKAGITRKQAGVAIDLMIAEIIEGVKGGNTVALPGLGTFSVAETKERMGVRPGTKERIKIAATRKLKFKASSSLKNTF